MSGGDDGFAKQQQGTLQRTQPSLDAVAQRGRCSVWLGATVTGA